MSMLRKKSKKKIVINVEALEVRVAILDDSKLEDFYIERPSEEHIVGSIFKGKIQNLEDGLQASFIDIGMKKNAFIHYWDMVPEDAVRLEQEEGVRRSRTPKKKRYSAGEMKKRFPVGSEIIVQVTKGAIGTKGPRVTANLSIAGRYLVMMPGSSLKGVSRKIDDDKERLRLKKVLSRIPIPDNNGLIVRTAGAGARKTSFARDVRALTHTWEEIQTRIKELPAPCRLYAEPDLIERVVRDSLAEDIGRFLIDSRHQYDRIKGLVAKLSRRTKNRIKIYDGDAPIFEHLDIERQLETAFRRRVWLKSGGYLIFDETEALVAIDVNTGRHKGGGTQEESVFQVNMEAVQEIVRQLRLRNVGGLVVIDFIDMKHRRHQNSVHRTLKDGLKSDKARTNILPISELGLLEMTRQRVDESIRQTNYTDCPYCRGRGKIKSGLSMSVEIQRRITEIMRRLRKDNEGIPLKIIINPTVLDRLRKEDEALLVDIEKKFGRRLTFVADPNMHLEDFTISNGSTNEKLYSSVDH